jgi:hypothetical protein
MILARIVWVPFPFRAGFTITDDTDGATMMKVRGVYDFLRTENFRITKSVWPFAPEERCGIPPLPDICLTGVTLQDKEYLEYCRQLHKEGFEICLHGASAGNNRRDRIRMAFSFLKENVGPADTYICHSKCADNVYWGHKIANFIPFRLLIRAYSKYRCSGEIESSPYFWGDICRSEINQIRLFRTTHANTLAVNPSMPYFDPNKPYVNGWFSATKRKITDFAEEETLGKLKRNYGMTVLYHYLHNYASGDTGALKPEFKSSILTIAHDNEVLVDTVSNLMRRLRAIQGLFVLFDKEGFWVLNIGSMPVADIQIVLSTDAEKVIRPSESIVLKNNVLVLRGIGPKSLIRITTLQPVAFKGKRSIQIGNRKRIHVQLAEAMVFINLGETLWNPMPKIAVDPLSHVLLTQSNNFNEMRLSRCSLLEEMRLFCHEAVSIGAEIIQRKRPVSPHKYLEHVAAGKMKSFSS